MPLRSFVLLLAALAATVAACADGGMADRGGCRPAPGCVSPAASAPARAATPVVSLAALPWTPDTGVVDGCGPPYPVPPHTVETVFCADPATMEAASVVRIVDGDTLRAIVAGVEEPVRLFGVDTPERGARCFKEAAEVLRALVVNAGGQIRLQSDARNRDSFDRLLRYVYTPDGLSVDAVLIAAGVAYAWTRDGARRAPLIELEESARAERRGCLWR